ncbi:ABC transporter permease [Pseudomonas putida]|uniref:ABC transporter permease n=1 Tax=Pseudomonas putida TaxID=303 RepID=UPI0021694B30|nr:ABC transporter permease [Pseudomonas putida]MCS4065608.1 capsular polysaccharide transport system permease protein [Pseudomonas putida]
MTSHSTVPLLLYCTVPPLKLRSSLQIQKTVIFALVLREIKSRLGKTRLGAVWILLEPLCHLLVISVLYTYLRGRNLAGVEFPVFVFVGLAPFLLFRNTSLRLMDSPRENRSLFAYKQIKPLDAYIARVIVEFCVAFIVYLIIACGFTWYGFDMTISFPIEWMLMLAFGIVFSFALGIFFSLIAHALPAARIVIRMMYFPLYLISGILVPPAYLPTNFMPVLLYNPFLHIIELIRSFVIPFYTAAEGVNVEYPLAVTLILLFLGLGAYRARRLHLVSSKNG